MNCLYLLFLPAISGHEGVCAHICIYAYIKYIHLRVSIHPVYTQRNTVNTDILDILLLSCLFYLAVYNYHFCNFFTCPPKCAFQGFTPSTWWAHPNHSSSRVVCSGAYRNFTVEDCSAQWPWPYALGTSQTTAWCASAGSSGSSPVPEPRGWVAKLPAPSRMTMTCKWPAELTRLPCLSYAYHGPRSYTRTRLCKEWCWFSPFSTWITSGVMQWSVSFSWQVSPAKWQIGCDMHNRYAFLIVKDVPSWKPPLVWEM